MPILPITVLKLNESDIEAAVAKVERSFAPSVVRIRFDVGYNWKEEDSVFFKVLLADEVGATGKEIRKVGEAVEKAIEDRLDLGTFGLHTYFNYRMVSEQAKLKDKDWA